MTGFHFLTRTWRTGYRFTPADRDAEERFYRRIKAAGIFGTEEPFALFDGVCVIAGGMETGKRDKEGRAIRFSFMMECDAEIFAGLIAHWDEAVRAMRSCFDWEAYKREEIIFAADDFVKALKEYRADANITTPSRGHVLKWDKSGLSDIITTTQTKSSWPKILAACAVVLAVIAGWFMLWPSEREPKNAGILEIYSDMRRAMETMREAYTYMSMIDDDAGLALEYSRSKYEEAGRMLDELAVKLNSFDIASGDL